MKVLFLDIDGVLNRHDTKERCGPFTGVDRELSGLLLSWLNHRPNIAVVLSSTWRDHPEMHSHLHDAGIHWIGVTPRMSGARGFEIQDWLDKHPEVTQYAILDDSSDMLPSQMPFFVQTHYDHGVTQEALNKLTAILG